MYVCVCVCVCVCVKERKKERKKERIDFLINEKKAECLNGKNFLAMLNIISNRVIDVTSVLGKREA